MGKVESLVQQAWYRWLEFWTLNRVDRMARAEMNAHYLWNPRVTKWTAQQIGWPYEIGSLRSTGGPTLYSAPRQLGGGDMRTVLICAALMVVPAGAGAQDEFDGAMVEEWVCREFSEDSGKILIRLWRASGMKEGFGYLEYAGVSFPSLFNLDGLSLRWNWELGQDGTWEYSFAIKPDGTGLFYDFSGVEKGGSTTARDIYTCKSGGEEKVSEDAAISWARWAIGNFRGEIDSELAAELEEMLD